MLIPQLIEYQKNPIRVALDDLPIDAQILKEEITVIPYHRSGLVVKFPIKSADSAIMKLLLPSGDPVPTEAVAKMNEEEIPIGRDGEVYATGLGERNELLIQWDKKSYRCEFTYEKSEDPLPDLGTIQCRE